MKTAYLLTLRHKARSLFCTVLFCGSLIFALSCTSDNKDEKPIEHAEMQRTAPFALPNELATLKTDIRRIDLAKRGYEDALVTVFPKNPMEAKIGFQALQIFEFDTQKQAFVRAHEEKVFYGKSLDTRDLDGDGTMEISIKTDGGGNSENASLGMTILKKQNGKYARIVSFDAGNPDITTMTDADKTYNAIVMNDVFVPEFLARTEAVTVLDSVVVLASNPQESEKLRGKFMEQELKKAEQRYRDAQLVLKANRSEQAAFAVYAEAVAVLRLMNKTVKSADVPRFMYAERAYWRAMLPARYQKALGLVFA